MARGHVVWAIGLRDVAEERRARLAVLLDLAFGVVNLLVFAYISRAFPHPAADRLAGASSYFAFASVGIAFLLVVQAATVLVIRRAREEQCSGTLEALECQPVTVVELGLGISWFAYALAIVRAGFYLAVSAFVLGLSAPRASWVGLVVVLVPAALAMMAIGIAMCALALVWRRGEALTRVLLVGLGFVSGAYFPAAGLPCGLRVLGSVLPPRLAIDGLRAALFHSGSWLERAGELGLFAVVGLPLALLALRGALTLMTRDGTLTRA